MYFYHRFRWHYKIDNEIRDHLSRTGKLHPLYQEALKNIIKKRRLRRKKVVRPLPNKVSFHERLFERLTQ